MLGNKFVSRSFGLTVSIAGGSYELVYSVVYEDMAELDYFLDLSHNSW